MKRCNEVNQDQDFNSYEDCWKRCNQDRTLIRNSRPQVQPPSNSNALPLPQTTSSSTSSPRNSASTIPLPLTAVPTSSEDTRTHYSSCLVLNVQSMNPSASSTSRWKVPEISALIQKEKSKNHSLSFIALTETWLKSYMSDAQLQIPGYSVSRSHRDARLGGGVLLYSHVNLVSAL